MSYFNPVALEGYIKAIQAEGIVTVPKFLREDSRIGLLSELEGRHFTRNQLVKGRHNVQQRFSSVTLFREGSLFYKIRLRLEVALNEACISAGVPLSRYLRFSEMVVQRYEPCPAGISVHKDGASFINIIAILVLEGEGQFYLHKKREDTNPCELQNEPGDLLLMGGPGLFGLNLEPFHSVGAVKTRRASFTLRQHKKKAQF